MLWVRDPSGTLITPGGGFISCGSACGALRRVAAEQEIWFAFLEAAGDYAGLLGESTSPHGLRRWERHQRQRGVNLKVVFPASDPQARLEPFGRLSTRVSFLTGNDPNRWQTDVPVWSGVRYVDIYPGADLEISGQAGSCAADQLVEGREDEPLVKRA